MEIPQLDRSYYLKGLLITARKDKQLSEIEISIIKKISKRLGFSSDFFEETITNLLHNKYITEEPIKFSRQDIAESFIEDVLKLAISDDSITEEETAWILETAKINGGRGAAGIPFALGTRRLALLFNEKRGDDERHFSQSGAPYGRACQAIPRRCGHGSRT